MAPAGKNLKPKLQIPNPKPQSSLYFRRQPARCEAGLGVRDQLQQKIARGASVQGFLVSSKSRTYIIPGTSCGGCPSQDQCGAVVDCHLTLCTSKCGQVYPVDLTPPKIWKSEPQYSSQCKRGSSTEAIKGPFCPLFFGEGSYDDKPLPECKPFVSA